MDRLTINNDYLNNNAVITSQGKAYSYGDLHSLSQELASCVEARALVFCLCKNTIDSLISYLSFITNNIVPLMLDARLDRDLLENLIEQYRPNYVWAPDAFTSHLPYSDKVKQISDYTLLRCKVEDHYPLHDDLALLLTTSGSTGSPKLVKLTYDNLYANAAAIAEYLSIDEHERPITSLPMHYSFGLSVINSHLLKGATLLLTDNSLMEKDFWSFLKEYKATSLSGVPYTFEILKRLRFFRMDLPYLKTITQAGGKLNENLNREFSEYCQNNRKRFFVMYGQTEATARMSYLAPEYSLAKLGSGGVAIPGGKFSLIDDEGVLINEPNKEGELVYSGKNVSMGYAECGMDLAKGDENKGVLKTGDIAKRDEDGFYYIVGRKKRFIKLFGNRVNLDETEILLKNVIHDCACAGSDEKMLIYITDKSKVKEIKDFISHKTGINPHGFDVFCIEKIPKNASGKTIYSALSETL